MLPHWTKAQLIRRSPLCQLVQMIHFKRTGTRLTHRLHTMMMTTTAMRKTKPAAAEPMMSGSFSWILVLYSSIKKRNTYINRRPCAHTHTESQAETYGRASEPLHMEGAMGDRQTYGWMNQWASWHLDWLQWTIFQSTLNVLRCRGYGQIIWQKACEVSRESMFGWDPDWSGSQEQESSYWMGTQRQSQTLLLSTANDTI